MSDVDPAVEWLERNLDEGDPDGDPDCPLTGKRHCPDDPKLAKKCPRC